MDKPPREPPLTQLSTQSPTKRLASGIVGALFLFIASAVWQLPGTVEVRLGATAPSPLTASATEVRFVALGDTGKPNQGAERVAEAIRTTCRSRGCDFGLLLGDNVYPDGMESPQEPRMDALLRDRYGPVGIPWYLVLGNHDWQGWLEPEPASWQLDWAARTPGFELPSTAYTFSIGDLATFIALDTTRVFWNGPETHQPWLDATLGWSTSTWRIGFGHHPVRSNGRHGNAGAYEGLPWVPYLAGGHLQTLADEVICPSVDLWISGHDHNLQWIDHCGTTFIVSGAGATVTDEVDRGNTPTFSAYTLGFSWISISETEIQIAFIDADGETLFEGTRAAR